MSKIAKMKQIIYCQFKIHFLEFKSEFSSLLSKLGRKLVGGSSSPFNHLGQIFGGSLHSSDISTQSGN